MKNDYKQNEKFGGDIRIISLTIPEFLSLYTGVVLVDNFQQFTNALNKVYENDVSIKGLCARMAYEKKFIDNINATNPNLAQKVKMLGKFRLNKNLDKDAQIAAYCSKFEKLVGAKSVSVDSMANFVSRNDSFEF